MQRFFSSFPTPKSQFMQGMAHKYKNSGGGVRVMLTWLKGGPMLPWELIPPTQLQFDSPLVSNDFFGWWIIRSLSWSKAQPSISKSNCCFHTMGNFPITSYFCSLIKNWKWKKKLSLYFGKENWSNELDKFGKMEIFNKHVP